MNTIRRKILADILSRKARTALVSLSIMVGVFGVVLLVSMGDIVVSQIKEDITTEEIAMTHVYVRLPFGDTTLEENVAYLAELEKMPGVTTVEGQVNFPISWREANSDEHYVDGVIRAFTEPFDQVQLEPVARVIEGRYPGRGKQEIVVERRFAETHGMNIGDELSFLSSDSGVDSGAWEIVGTVAHTYLTVSPSLTAPVPSEDSIYANFEDAQMIANLGGLSSVYARYESYEAAKEGLDGFLEAIATSPVGDDHYYMTTMNFLDDPENSFLIELVTQATSVLSTLGVIAMAVSGFLVINVINTIVVEQKQQIGIMKALGATRTNTFLIYAGLAFFYGLIGTIFGVLLAVPVASLLAPVLARSAFTYVDSYQMSITGILVGMGMGLLVPVVVSLPSVYLGTRVTILQAITDLGISSTWGTSRTAHLIGRLPVPITIRQALSNTVQKRLRLLLPVATLTVAVGAFMGVMAVFTSLNDQISALIDSFQYDIVVTPQDHQDFGEMAARLTAIDGIEAAYPGYSLTIRLEGYESAAGVLSASNQISATGFDPDTPSYRFDLHDGQNWQANYACALAGNENWQQDSECMSVVVTRSVANAIDKEVGDTLVVMVGDRSHEMTIIGIDRFPFNSVFIRWDVLAALSGFVDENDRPQPTSFYLHMHEDTPTIATAGDMIADIKSDLVATGVQATYVNQPEENKADTEQLASFMLMFNITSVVMAIVGAIGLLATLSMSVNERQKEIGVMRSIGAGSGAIAIQFLTEGTLVGLIAWIIGLPLSYFLNIVLVDRLPFGGGALVAEYPIIVAALGFGGAILITTVASLWPSIAATRKTVADILRYQ